MLPKKISYIAAWLAVVSIIAHWVCLFLKRNTMIPPWIILGSLMVLFTDSVSRNDKKFSICWLFCYLILLILMILYYKSQL